MAECPFISERSSNYGHEPYECDCTDKEVSSDKYHHLCRYDNVAIEQCPIRKKDYKKNHC